MKATYSVDFEYADYDGVTVIRDAATILEQDEWFWAENKDLGRSDPVSTAHHWHPIKAALQNLIGKRVLIKHKTKPFP